MLVPQEPEGFQDDIIVIQEEEGAAMHVFEEEDIFKKNWKIEEELRKEGEEV